MPTDDDRKRLRELAMAATPGPWCVQGPHPFASVYVDDGEWSPSLIGSDVAEQVAPVHIATMPTMLRTDQRCEDDRDAAFIAAAHPQAVLALLDRLEAVERLLSTACDKIAISEGGDAKDDDGVPLRHWAARIRKEAGL